MKLYFATQSLDKTDEIQRLLSGFEIEQFEMDFSSVKGSLEQIAKLKVGSAYGQLQAPVFCEATGIFLDALEGFPGPDTKGVIERVGLVGIANRAMNASTQSAYTQTSVACVLPDQSLFEATGKMPGTIVMPEEQYANAKKFNRIIIPAGYNKLLADFTTEERDAISHRALAFKQLRTRLIEYQTHSR